MAKKLALALLAGIAGLAATPAEAALGVSCSNTDISPTAIDCSGFVQGNAIGGSATSPTAASLLAELGYNGSLTGIELIENLNGNTTINFNTLLTGLTIVGIHYGNGQGSPGRPAGSAGKGDGDDTAFYLFDAGAGLDTFTLKFNSSSNARLYQTGIRGVPEPGTWALMLLGFGFVGSQMRRQRRNVVPQMA